MTALFTTFLTLTLAITFTYANGQVNDQNIRLTVLRKAIVDSNFIFGKWTDDLETETHLRYLGQAFKILIQFGFGDIRIEQLQELQEANAYLGKRLQKKINEYGKYCEALK